MDDVELKTIAMTLFIHGLITKAGPDGLTGMDDLIEVVDIAAELVEAMLYKVNELA